MNDQDLAAFDRESERRQRAADFAQAHPEYNPRPGSRPYMLLNLKVGERAFLEAPAGRLAPFMQQVATDISRVGLQGKITQSLVLGIEPATRAVIELVMLTRRG